MSFFTENEVGNFDFSEAYIAELRFGLGPFYMLLDNVKILEANSRNRDVRTMRTNGLTFRITEPQIVTVTEEGYKLYNANGVLLQEVPDRTVDPQEYAGLCKELEEAMIYKLEKTGNIYRISIDGEERGYTLVIKGSGDTEEWERFMNLAEI